MLPIRAVKDVVLSDFFPGQFTALLAEFIAQAREFFLLAQKILARFDPL